MHRTRTNTTTRRWWRATATLVAVSTIIAACGDDDDEGGAAATTADGGSAATDATSTETTSAATEAADDTDAATTEAETTTGDTEASGGGGAGGDCVAAAEEFLVPYDSEPTALPDSFTPLSQAPEPGGTIINMSNGNIPSDVETADEMQNAAEAIGWTADRIVFDGTVEDLNAKFLDAVARQPTVIAMAGFPVAAVQAGIEAAADAGILVSLASIADPVISNPGFGALSNGPEAAEAIEEVNAYLMMRDSGCAGRVLSLTAPFPILQVGLDKFNQTVEEQCPDCEVTDLELNPADIGSPAMTNAIVSALQADDSITYVHATFGNLATGLNSALNQANISDIKIFGNVPDTNAVQALQDGTNAWWLTQNSTTQAWQELDAALRAIESGDVVTTPDIPFGVLTPENVDPEGTAVPSLPENFRELFQEVWLVG